jgi:SAM-dependent methyltransferase
LDIRETDRRTVCPSCGAWFPILDGRPVLVRHDNQVFPLDAYISAKDSGNRRPRSGIMRLVPGISVNLAVDRCLRRFAGNLKETNPAWVLVVGGGRQRSRLDTMLSGWQGLRFVYCDVDTTADVDLFCDAHDLPFVDRCFDGVITTAVLEHVMYPERVAAEIGRVLKPGGMLYSEMPFMQQVHEGAYDFTRFTLSGHRRLFNHFDEIESGLVAGPATALLWSIENFALAFTANRPARLAIKAAIRLGLFWLKYFDYFLAHKPQAADGASCTYFLGRKTAQVVPDLAIIESYVGAKPLRHL